MPYSERPSWGTHTYPHRQVPFNVMLFKRNHEVSGKEFCEDFAPNGMKLTFLVCERHEARKAAKELPET